MSQSPIKMLKKEFNILFINLVILLIALISVGGGLYIKIANHPPRSFVELFFGIDEVQRTKELVIEELAKKNKDNLKKLIETVSVDTKFLEKYFLKTQFDSLKEQIKEVDEKTLALRQAINPLNPDEVLTIARLTDNIIDLKGDFNDLSAQIQQSQKEFKSSISREINTINNLFTAILFTLVPLVINLVYNFYKDVKSRERSIKNDEEKENKSSSAP